MTSIHKQAGVALRQPRAYGSARVVLAAARLARAVPWGICAITALAAALRLAELEDVPGNQFYDAAVRSMGLSWHNFFFGAFDTRGLLAVDKPPLDLWLQVASTKLFGWGSVSLKLPEALAGTLAVPLLYAAARRTAGQGAALAAAAALAVLPLSVLTSRSDTMDSLTMLCVVGALRLTVRAAARGSRRWLVLAGVAFGLAFNVKLLEGLIAAPALMLMYGVGAPLPLRRRLADIAIASSVLVAVALSWPVAVTLAPGSHPFPIGSTDGSVWNAIFVFNGFGRAAGTLAAGGVYSAPPGPLRLFSGGAGNIGQLFGSMLVPALALGAAGALATVLGRGGEPDPRRRLRLAFSLAVLVWLAVGVAGFSHVAVLHARYLESFTPAVALTVGGGLAALVGTLGERALGERAARGRPALVAAPALALALAGVCWYVSLLASSSLLILAAAVLAALAVALAGAALLRPRFARAASALAAVLVLASCLIFPIHQSLSVVRMARSDSLGLQVEPDRVDALLAQYLRPRTAGIRYTLASDTPLKLAGLIIRHATPILPLTSFGDRAFVSVAKLRALIAAGAVRYALVGTYPCPVVGHRAACVPAALWIRSHGVNVSAAVGLPAGLWISLYRLVPS